MVVLAVVRLAVLAVLAVVQVVAAVLQQQHQNLEAVEVAVALMPPGAQVVGVLAAKALLLHVLVANVQVVSLPAAVVLIFPFVAPAVVLAAVVQVGRGAVLKNQHLCQHLWHQEPEEPRNSLLTTIGNNQLAGNTEVVTKNPR